METKYLGIDYGLKRIGISVSDSTKKYAFQRDYLINDKNSFQNLKKIIESENISDIIIGYPLKFNSEKTHITDDVIAFSEKLKNFLTQSKISCNIIFFDERLTSNLAKDNMINSGLSKKKRQDKGIIDSISAQIILQDYLNSKK